VEAVKVAVARQPLRMSSNQVVAASRSGLGGRAVGKIQAVERDALIRVEVLSNMLVKALEELDDGRFTSSRLLAQLREVGDRAAEEVDQLRSSR
jgi:hypothetical protein